MTKLKFVFEFKESSSVAKYYAGEVHIYLNYITSYQALLDTIDHEVKHHLIKEIIPSNEEQDHWAMQALETEWH